MIFVSLDPHPPLRVNVDDSFERFLFDVPTFSRPDDSVTSEAPPLFFEVADSTCTCVFVYLDTGRRVANLHITLCLQRL